MKTLTDIFARAFPNAGEAAHVASHYRYYRNKQGRGARDALRHALRHPAAYVPGFEYYGASEGASARSMQGRDVLRWIESTSAVGLRFIGWADELPGGPNHTGWFTDSDDQQDKLRGGVWQLPGCKGKARLVYGYAEFEGRNSETNKGSARICVSDIIEINRTGEDSAYDDMRDSDEMREAVTGADQIAESVAEEARDYNDTYNAGRQAAELDSEAIAARREALPLLGELRAARRSGLVPSAFPAAYAALHGRVLALLEIISTKREERESAWADCPSCDESAWAAGFMDESEGGFVRAVRLGYSKASDWQGSAESNPCRPKYGESGWRDSMGATAAERPAGF